MRQGKRLRKDVTSHSIAKKAKESIFSVDTSKPDLKLLKEAYGLLSSREKHDFEVQFGCIRDLLSVVLNWNLFRAMLKFCVLQYQAFVFPQFELFTLEKVQEMLQAIWRFPFEFSQPLVTIRDDSYWFDWNATLMALGKRLEGMTSSQKINFVALGIYGMVVFPMVVALFEQLLHTSAFNPTSIVIVETLWSMKEIWAKRSGHFSGCIELFTTWAHGHLRGPQFEALFSVPVKDRKTEDWHRSLLVATINDVGFVLLTWNDTHYLAPLEGHHSIPLLGIHGGVTYSVKLASCQFGKAQSVPYLDDALQSHFDYMSSPAIVSKAHEEQWRLSWIAKLSLPLEVTKMKNFTIMDLTAKLGLSQAQRCQLLEKYDELALDHELLKRGKELADQQVARLKDKIASLKRDLAASKKICGKQKRSLEFAEEQRKKLLQVKVDLKAKEKENKELVEKVIKQQELKGKVIKWRNAYNKLLSDYDALQKEL
ncbi:hypothetical protein SLEP1_g34546 [Rubroshorea leprosula]|uniref:DUF7745 domain-containing protein n=1 Tax=Rubroshorea leprosula TaxID=152421 RepID=A0AAV5KK94_9ROSI|nr:hypothetical protein SLEP1_g34546 [Rubroshorea leprosula]